MTGNPVSTPSIGKVILRIDDQQFEEGVHFAVDRVNGKVFPLIDSELGKKGTVLSLKRPLEQPKRKKRKKAQWKSR